MASPSPLPPPPVTTATLPSSRISSLVARLGRSSGSASRLYAPMASFAMPDRSNVCLPPCCVGSVTPVSLSRRRRHVDQEQGVGRPKGRPHGHDPGEPVRRTGRRRRPRRRELALPLLQRGD